MNDYYYLIVAFITLITTQFAKFIIESVKNKKLIIKRFFTGSGGMPSSHSALASGITTAILLKLGFNSPLFALSLVFSLIVWYDAMNHRLASENHAITLNQVVGEMLKHKKLKPLKEELGHDPIEVVIGIIHGALIATLLFLLIK